MSTASAFAKRAGSGYDACIGKETISKRYEKMNRNTRRSSSRARNVNRSVRSSSGMSRGRFLRTAGIGAAGIGAAMMGMGGVVGAVGPMGYGAPNVGLFYHTTATSTIWQQAATVAKEVFAEFGINSATLVEMPATAEGVRDAILAGGYNAIIGCNVSASAARLAEGIMLAGVPVQFIETVATADDMNPLYSGGSKNTMPPMYFHRTAVTSSQWGAAMAQEWKAYFVPPRPSLPTQRAFIVRTVENYGAADFMNDEVDPQTGEPLKPKTPDPFGLQAKDGFDAILGGTSKMILCNRNGTLFKIDGYYYYSTYNYPGGVPGYDPLTSCPSLNNGVWLVGAALDSTNAANATNAMSDVHALPTCTIYYGTVGTVATQIEGDSNARMYMQQVGIGVHADHPSDANYAGFQAWESWGLSTAGIGVDHRLLRAFDAAWLMSSAMLNSHDMKNTYDIITEFSRGTVIYPYLDSVGEFSRLPQKYTANYEGASGPIDFSDIGECRVSWYKVWITLWGDFPYWFTVSS